MTTISKFSCQDIYVCSARTRSDVRSLSSLHVRETLICQDRQIYR